MQEVELKQLALDALADLKGNDIRCLDVRAQTDVTDYMILVSGTSSRHIAALANNVLAEATKVGVKARGVEGQQSGEWILIDLVDVVIHVMVPQAREFYDIERLWSIEFAPEENNPIEH
jgi:ribosome-associated protein